MTLLAERIQSLRARIQRACEACGRVPDSVELLPVAKHQPIALIQEAQALGFDRFGENYVQEGAAKATAIPEGRFLLIGPLQRNKARLALAHFQEIMTLDRPELAQRLRNQAAELNVVRPVWIQVELWDEATKCGGCPESAIPTLLDALGNDPRLPFQGFLAIPPPGDTAAFRDMARLREAWRQRLGKPLRLSMGMSGDLEAAIAQGSDQVRIGTAFFGARS